MAVLCTGDGGLQPCPHKQYVQYETKLSTVRGWRGLFCAQCFTSWFLYQERNGHLSKNDKVTVTVIW